jgi:hypothetical protein
LALVCRNACECRSREIQLPSADNRVNVGPGRYHGATDREKCPEKYARKNLFHECSPVAGYPAILSLQQSQGVTRSGNDCACILRMTLPLCALTVTSLMPSFAAISLSCIPALTNARKAVLESPVLTSDWQAARLSECDSDRHVTY